MTESRDEWIKKRAYALWEDEGYPTGRDASHWEQASKERMEMEKTSPNGIEVKAKRKAPPAVKSNGKAEKKSTNGAAAETVAVASKSPRATRKAISAKL